VVVVMSNLVFLGGKVLADDFIVYNTLILHNDDN